jgi:hypothetical protein
MWCDVDFFIIYVIGRNCEYVARSFYVSMLRERRMCV